MRITGSICLSRQHFNEVIGGLCYLSMLECAGSFWRNNHHQLDIQVHHYIILVSTLVHDVLIPSINSALSVTCPCVPLITDYKLQNLKISLHLSLHLEPNAYPELLTPSLGSLHDPPRRYIFILRLQLFLSFPQTKSARLQLGGLWVFSFVRRI